MKLKNQLALVTGSSGGIGEAVADALARQGAGLCVVGRNQEALAAVAERIATGHGTVDVCTADLTSESDIDGLVDHVRKAFGRLDILVHSAGTISHGRIEDAPIELLDRMYNANVRGPLQLTRKLLPFLRKPRGQVVFINSSAGLVARANSAYHAAMQHAFRALADGLREEVNAEDVRVLSVYPGRTATRRTQDLHMQEGLPYEADRLLQPEDVASVILNSIMLPWTAEVTNISIRPMQKTY